MFGKYNMKISHCKKKKKKAAERRDPFWQSWPKKGIFESQGRFVFGEPDVCVTKKETGYL